MFCFSKTNIVSSSKGFMYVMRKDNKLVKINEKSSLLKHE